MVPGKRGGEWAPGRPEGGSEAAAAVKSEPAAGATASDDVRVKREADTASAYPIEAGTGDEATVERSGAIGRGPAAPAETVVAVANSPGGAMTGVEGKNSPTAATAAPLEGVPGVGALAPAESEGAAAEPQNAPPSASASPPTPVHEPAATATQAGGDGDADAAGDRLVAEEHGGAVTPPELGAEETSDPAMQQYRTLKVEDALAYLEQVKAQFENQPRVYAKFLDIMKEFKAQAIDTPAVIERVTMLFRGHPDLILGFNTFLPPGYKIDLTEDMESIAVHTTTPGGVVSTLNVTTGPGEMSQAHESAASPTAKPRSKAERTPRTLAPEHLQTADGYPVGSDGSPYEMSTAAMSAPYGPPSTYAMPPPPPPPAEGGMAPASTQYAQNREFDHAIYYVNKIKTRFQHQPSVYQHFLSVLHSYQQEAKPIREVYERISELFQGHADLLEEFRHFLPEEPTAGAYGQDAQEAAAAGKRRAPWGGAKSTKKGRQRAAVGYGSEMGAVGEPYGAAMAAAAASGLSPMTQASRNELLFFDKLRARMEPRLFHEFIKCLSLYSQEIIGRTELLSLADELFGHRPLLTEAFRAFLEAAAPTKKGKRVADGTWMHAHGGVEAALSILEGRAPPAAVAPPADGLWRHKSLSEAAAESTERCDTSYKRVQQEYQAIPCSGRGPLEKRVLNDTWVSVPTGSEEGSFKHLRRNQYEDNLFRCEDDRYELDMVIETNAATIEKLEPLAQVIGSMSDEDKGKHVLAEHALSAVHFRAIERVYGAQGADVVMHVKLNPSVAVPVVLQRLKHKDEEWRRARVEMDKIWREICERNFFRSLDHRSFYFKQSDKRSTSTKGLLQDLHDLASAHSLMAAIQAALLSHSLTAGFVVPYGPMALFSAPWMTREAERAWRARAVAATAPSGAGATAATTAAAARNGNGEETGATAAASAAAAVAEWSRAHADPQRCVFEPPSIRFTLARPQAHQQVCDLMELVSHMEYGAAERSRILRVYRRVCQRFFGVELQPTELPADWSSESEPRSESPEHRGAGGDAATADEAAENGNSGAPPPVERGRKSGTVLLNNFLDEYENEPVPGIRTGAPDDGEEEEERGHRVYEPVTLATSEASAPSRVAETMPQRQVYRIGGVMYGDETIYLFFRLYEVVYQRLAAAYRLADSQARQQQRPAPPPSNAAVGTSAGGVADDDDDMDGGVAARSMSDTLLSEAAATATGSARPPDADSEALFQQFTGALRQLLVGALDAAKYEELCSTLLGPESYLLFTLDKVLTKLMKQVHHLAKSRFTALYLVQQQPLRTGTRPDDAEAAALADAAYCFKALNILREERGGHLYRIELAPRSGETTANVDAQQLRMLLLTGEQPVPRRRDVAEATDVASALLGFMIQPTPSHLRVPPLTAVVDTRALYRFERAMEAVSLQRRWRRRRNRTEAIGGRDIGDDRQAYTEWKQRLAAGVQVVNGLEARFSLHTLRMVYVDGTGDVLIRSERAMASPDRYAGAPRGATTAVRQLSRVPGEGRARSGRGHSSESSVTASMTTTTMTTMTTSTLTRARAARARRWHRWVARRWGAPDTPAAAGPQPMDTAADATAPTE